MTASLDPRTLLVAALVLLMAVPAGVGALGGAAASPASTSAGATVPAPEIPSVPTAALHGPAAVLARDERLLRADHVPTREIFLPNLHPALSRASGVIQPTYAAAPAPMGIGDLGVATVNGTTVGTVGYTSSVEAVVHINALNASYVNGDGVNSISMQLNTVLTHVDLFGSPSYQFWIQNVPTYTIQDQGFTIVDNIWNFSSPAFNFTANSLYSYHGFEVAPVYYFANGPVLHLPMPFTVRLWNNASVVNDRPTVYFNYSVTAANGTVFTGSYDRVEFNSTGLARPSAPAPPPTFQIDGQQYGDNGFLPNDAEIMIGGWSDGATQSFTNVNATMQLLTEANGTTTFRSVPSAYDFGFDTGETAEGIAEWSGPTVAHLGPGPSILHPLWGIKGAAYGHEDVAVSVAPANGFLFVSPGATFSVDAAAWVPLPSTGSVRMELPNGSYAFEALLSDHATRRGSLVSGGSLSLTLPRDLKVGIDTPLWAWGNAQLPAISAAGHGTPGAPYVLDRGGGSLSPLFGEVNDYLFPVFAGVFLAYTDAPVAVVSPPTFLIDYTLPQAARYVSDFGTPTTNDLELQTLNTSHVSILDAPVLSGWQLAGDVGEPLASVVIWNSTDTLLASNDFQDQGVALLIFGGSHNTIWGNRFTPSSPAAAAPQSLLNGSDQVGAMLLGSHDLVYNNYFDVPIPALTPPINITTFLPASYHDLWNISAQPASTVHRVNGVNLSGSILGLSVQGGNYWSNYGTPSNPYGVLPYNDSGLITSGGDAAPQLPFALYTVTFDERGLPSGTLWSVTLNGTTASSRSSTIVLWVPNGTYAYVVGHLAHHWARPSIGAIAVRGTARSVTIRWF